MISCDLNALWRHLNLPEQKNNIFGFNNINGDTDNEKGNGVEQVGP